MDRAFSIKGSGTVVTGTLAAGTIRERQELLLTPALAAVRVRGIESLKQRAGAVTGVARVAVNLRGDSRLAPARGMALVQPGRWALAHAWPTCGWPRPGSARRGSSPCTSARPGQWPGCACWAAGSPGSPCATRCPLHVGDRLLLRDPGAAAARSPAWPR